MSVTVQIAAKSQAMTAVMARVMRMVDRVDSARAAAIALPIGKGGVLPAAAGALITYVWVFDQLPAGRLVSPATPAFVVRYREAPGVSPEDVAPAIVQVIGSAAGPRVVGAVRGRVDQASRATADWDLDRDLKQEVVASTLEFSSRGVATIAPVAPLPPGDYAIVFRPTGTKKFAGTSVLSDAEEGRVFGIAWLFVVR